MELRICARRVDGITVIDCAGRIFGEQATTFRNTVGALLTSSKMAVLNLNGVTSMDSWGMTALIKLCLSARRNARTVAVAGVRPAISELFRLYHLLASIEIYDTADTAVAALQRAPVL
jgi:anti-anti-sigma factor